MPATYTWTYTLLYCIVMSLNRLLHYHDVYAVMSFACSTCEQRKTSHRKWGENTQILTASREGERVAKVCWVTKFRRAVPRHTFSLLFPTMHIHLRRCIFSLWGYGVSLWYATVRWMLHSITCRDFAIVFCFFRVVKLDGRLWNA